MEAFFTNVAVRAEELNLGPPGYETYSFGPTGLYGLIEHIRFRSLPGTWGAGHLEQEMVF